MRLVSDIFERLPMVWLLLGLLFISCGLYLGFDRSVSFIYMGIGVICSLYGLLLFFFMRREAPKQTVEKRLSPNFISIGSTVIVPSPVERGETGNSQAAAE